MINKNDTISIVQQCKLVSIIRSGIYYEPAPKFSKEDLLIMHEIDKIYLEYPFLGHRRIYDELIAKKFIIGRDRVLNYMKILGIKPIYPKPKTTINNKEHKIYPYLLKELNICRTNQVWATDITYIPLHHGFCYLVAIIDWYSRKILSWRLSNTMGASFCIEALKEALDKYGKPEIFNTDQGSQFTCKDFTSILLENNIKISMDSKGRALDNIIIERFWRSLKYENIYIYNYETISEVKKGIKNYIAFYNNKRRHSALNKKTPDCFFKQYLRLVA